MHELDAMADALRDDNGPLAGYGVDEDAAGRRKGLLGCMGSPMVKRVVIVFMLEAFLVGSGANLVFVYGPDLLRGVGVFDRATALVLVYMTNALGTTVAALQMDNAGRRALLLQGACGMFLGHLGAAVTVTALGLENGDSLGTEMGRLGSYVFVAFVGVATLYVAASFAPAAWVIPAEAFPQKYRAKAVGAISVAHWIAICIGSYSFRIIYSLGLASTFFLLAAIAILAFMFVVYCVPETAGKSLEDIQLMFAPSSQKNNNTNAYSSSGCYPPHQQKQQKAPLLYNLGDASSNKDLYHRVRKSTTPSSLSEEVIPLVANDDSSHQQR